MKLSLLPRLTRALRVFFALLVAMATPLAVTSPRLALAQSEGTADVILVGPSGVVLNAVGTTFTVDLQVRAAAAVSPDAVAAYVTFDPTYLELPDGSSGSPQVELVMTDAAETYVVIVNEVNSSAGTLFYAAGRLAATWPAAATITFARATFRVKQSPPSSVALGLQARSLSEPNRTDVAMSGASVLGQVVGASVSFAASTATPTHTPTNTPTATRTPVPPSPTRTAVPLVDTTAPSGGTTGGGTTGGGATGGGSTGGGSTGSTGGGTTGGSSTGATTTSPPPAAPAGQAAATATTPPGSAPFGDRARPVITDLQPGVILPLPPSVNVALNLVASPFERFYAERQGLRVLGNTLVAARRESGRTVQYFEKGRIEEHNDEPNPAWRFQYGLLVDELAQVRAALPVGGDSSSMSYAAIFLLSQALMRIDAPPGFVGGTQALLDGSVFIPFSASLLPGPGHVVPPNFWSYINNEDLFPGGWLHDVGLPLTSPAEAVVDKGPDMGRRILVQAFQRTILTYDPLNPADYQIERANVGTDYARAFPDRFQD